MKILIETYALNLIPKCNHGIDCLARKAGLCCYESQFRLYWVCVGKDLDNSHTLVSCSVIFFSCLSGKSDNKTLLYPGTNLIIFFQVPNNPIIL